MFTADNALLACPCFCSGGGVVKVRFEDLSRPLQAVVVKGWFDIVVMCFLIVIFVIGVVIVLVGG
jgi:hypothetical protein